MYREPDHVVAAVGRRPERDVDDFVEAEEEDILGARLVREHASALRPKLLRVVHAAVLAAEVEGRTMQSKSTSRFLHGSINHSPRGQPRVQQIRTPN